MSRRYSRLRITWPNNRPQHRRNKKPGSEVANPHAGFLNINLVSSHLAPGQ